MFECHFNYILEKIQHIQSNLINKLFFIKGIDSYGKSQTALFVLSNGSFIEECGNFFNIDKYLLSRSSKRNKLIISNFDNLNNIKRINCELDVEMSNFIQDNQVIVSAFGEEDNIDFI